MKIEFQFDTRHGVFRDSIILPDDHTFTHQEIEDMKHDRVDKWLILIDDLINNPPIEESGAL